MEKILKIIEKIPFFRGIEDDRLLSAFTGIRYYVKKYEKGTIIILQGVPDKTLYLLTTGDCICEMTDEAGKVLKIEDFNAPDALASTLLFADDPRIPVTVRGDPFVRQQPVFLPRFVFEDEFAFDPAEKGNNSACEEKHDTDLNDIGSVMHSLFPYHFR